MSVYSFFTPEGATLPLIGGGQSVDAGTCGPDRV